MWDLIKNIMYVVGGVGGFWLAFWKTYGKKWYSHYKGGRDAWRISLMEVQKMQNENISQINQKVDGLVYEFSQNGGKNTLGKIDKILHNQSVQKGTLEAMQYLDDTPTFKCDMLGNCFFVNVAYLELLGYSNPDEAYGKGWYKTIHPPEIEKVRKEFEDAIKSESVYVSSIKKEHKITKTVIPVKMMTKIVRDENNKAIEIVGQLKLK